MSTQLRKMPPARNRKPTPPKMRAVARGDSPQTTQIAARHPDSCIFHRHIERRGKCLKKAEIFTWLPNGLVWPMCKPCSESHQKLVKKMASNGMVSTQQVQGVRYDLPLDDYAALETWRAQDPEANQKILMLIDLLAKL